MADLKTGAKFIEKDPPLADQETKSIGRKILDYLAYLKEQLNFIFSNYGRRLTDADGHINELTRTAEETLSVIYDPETGLVSQIQQNADAITTKVSTSDYNGNEIVSKINQTATTVDISADKINLNGAVTANNNVQILQDGTIKAVNADLSGKFTITSGSMDVLSTQTFYASDYSASDLTIIQNIISGDTPATEEYLAKYDLNMDGVINASDLIIVRDLVNGAISSYTGSTGVKINPQNSIELVQVYSGSKKSVITPGSIQSSVLYAGNSYMRSGMLVIYNGTALAADYGKSSSECLTLLGHNGSGTLTNKAVLNPKQSLQFTNSSNLVTSSYNANSVKLGDGSTSYDRTLLDTSGLTFRNSSNTQTAQYPASLTASKALVTGTNGAVTTSSVTSTELGYLSGVTSAVQTQIGNLQTQINNISISPTHLYTGGTYSSATTSYKYAGYNVTIPAGKCFLLTVHAYYSTVEPECVCASNSSTTLATGSIQFEYNVDSLGTRARGTFGGYADTALTYYLWVKARGSGAVGVSFEGFYL